MSQKYCRLRWSCRIKSKYVVYFAGYQQPAYYPQAPQYGAQYGGGYAPPMQQQQPYSPYGIPQGAQVVGHGQFDAGARFNSGAAMNIPVSSTYWGTA